MDTIGCQHQYTDCYCTVRAKGNGPSQRPAGKRHQSTCNIRESTRQPVVSCVTPCPVRQQHAYQTRAAAVSVSSNMSCACRSSVDCTMCYQIRWLTITRTGAA